jgi:predicted amidohydrolase
VLAMMEIISITVAIAWFVDPMGEILYTRSHEEDIFTITLHKEKLDEVRNKLPFWKMAIIL